MRPLLFGEAGLKSRSPSNARNVTDQEIKETALRLTKERKYDAAMPLLQSASNLFPKEEILWQELVLAYWNLGNHGQAVESCKAGIRHHPRSAWLWRELGDGLIVLDRLDEAEKALDNATNLNADSPWVWRYWAKFHRKRQDYDQESEALETLDALGEATGDDLNLLGIAYHNHGNFAKALEFYTRSAANGTGVAPFFNIGLVCNHPEVSRDADAADAYRRALLLKPDYAVAKDNLEKTKQKLIPLAANAIAAAPMLLKPEERFQFYVNPFEALNVMENCFSDPNLASDLTPDELLYLLDQKALQRAKTRLLGEIKLEGKVGWMDSAIMDESRVLSLLTDLDDEARRSYHWHVFQNPRLLQFLTRGSVNHFLFDED